VSERGRRKDSDEEKEGLVDERADVGEREWRRGMDGRIR